MDLFKNLIEEHAHAIWKLNGVDSGTELDDWRTATQEFGHTKALTRQLDMSSSPEISHVLRAVLQHAPAVISVKDSGGRYLLVNNQFESLYRVSQNSLSDITDYDLFPLEQADELRANDLEVIATRQPLEFEEVVHDSIAVGEDRTFLSLKFPIVDRDGFPYAVGGISTDVTERKRATRCLLMQYAVTRALVEASIIFDSEPRILQAICTSLGWDIGILWRIDPIVNMLRCTEVWHAPEVSVPAFEQMSRGMTLSSGVGLPGRVWDTGQPIWIENVIVAENFPRATAALRDDMHGACAFPIQNGGNMLGVIEFFSREVQHSDPDLLQVMAGIGSQIAQFIEHRQAERAVLERAREFELARKIQLGLLPKAPPSIAGFAIDGASHPAQETGGDYLDFIPMPGRLFGIAIGDASGHGIGAALVMAETRAYLRARAATDLSVGEILTLVNRQLCADLPADHFVTLFFAGLDETTSTLTYTGAGHWPGYVLDQFGQVRELLYSTNIPLGIDPDSVYPVAPPVVLRRNEIVLLLTDGILEASSPDGTMYGVERALESVSANRAETPAVIVAELLSSVHAFAPDIQSDDMTVIVLKADSTLI